MGIVSQSRSKGGGGDNNGPTDNGGGNTPEENSYNPIPPVTSNQNVPFDVIPLPSEGKLYPHKRDSIRVAYMTASDENILTNPNLLETGKFLEVLFDRKLLDSDVNYRDLHVGDRNAIMLWLRATGYGEIYPVELIDPKTGELFNADINLSKLPIKKLKAEPDAEGYFDFQLPLSKANIKFRLLSVGDIEDIEAHVDNVKKLHGI